MWLSSLKALKASLRSRLLLLVALAALPALGLTVYSGLEQRAFIARKVQAEALTLARVVARDHQELVDNTHQLLEILSNLPEVREGPPEACNELLAQFLRSSKIFMNLGVTAPDGQVSCSAIPLDGPLNLADRSWFQRAAQSGEFAIGDYQVSRLTGQANLALAHPILNDQGQLQAVVSASIGLDWLGQFLSQADLPQGTSLAVIDSQGAILARFPQVEEYVGGSIADTPTFAQMAAQGEGTYEAVAYDGVQRLYGFTRFGGTQGNGELFVRVGIPSAIAYAEAERALRRNLNVLALAALLAIIAALAGGEVLALRPARALLESTRRLAAGDYTARTGLRPGPGELGQLAASFDEMASALLQREQERDRSQQELRRVNRVLRMVSGCNQALVQAGQETELLERVCRSIVETGGYRLAWVGYAEQDEEQSIRPIARSGGEDGCLKKLRLSWGENEFGRSTCGAAIRTGQTSISHDVQADPSFEPWRAQAREKGIASAIALPLRIEGATFGVLAIYAGEAGAFEAQEVGLLEGLASDLAHGIQALRGEAAHRQAQIALQEMTERLRAIIQASPLPILFLDPTGNVQLWNPAAEKTFGWTAEEIIGMPYPLAAGEKQAEFRSLFSRALSGESLAGVEVTRQHKDGSLVDVSIHTAPIRDASGEISGVMGVLADIGERKKAEADLHAANEALSALVASSPLAIFTLDAAGRVGTWNPAAERIFGYSAGEAAGKTLPSVQPENKAEFDAIRKRVFSGETILGLEVQRHRKDGTPIEISIYSAPLRDAHGNVTGIMVIDADITERKRTEAEIHRRQRELEALAARLAEIQESERSQLASELHDRVGQTLTALSLNLNMARSLLSPDSVPAVGPRLEDAQRLVETAAEHIRDVMAELYPPALDDYGLLPALRWFGERYAAQSGLNVLVEGPKTPRLPHAVETALFRIAQEALTNIAKHAGASRAEICLELADELARLTIADDGEGFDPAAAAENSRIGWGLKIMRERALAVGGELRLYSAPGQGTRLVVEVER